MAPLNLFIASLNFTQAETISGGIFRFIADRSLPIYAAETLRQTWSWDEWWANFLRWLSRPGTVYTIREPICID